MSEQAELFTIPTALCASAHRRQGWRKPRPAPSNRGRHISSLETYDQIRAAGAVVRRRIILDWLRANGPATDREVRDGLFGAGGDMNLVRPRISDMLHDGTLAECADRVLDPATGRTVRRVRLGREVEA